MRDIRTKFQTDSSDSNLRVFILNHSNYETPMSPFLCSKMKKEPIRPTIGK